MAHNMVDAVLLGDPDRFIAASVVNDQPFDAVEARDGPRQVIQRYRERFRFVIARDLDNQLWQGLALELGPDTRASTIIRLRRKQFSRWKTIFPTSNYGVCECILALLHNAPSADYSSKT